MSYKVGTYRTTAELLTALRSFMVTDCSLTERSYTTEGTGSRLLVSDANAQYNFRTATDEVVCDTQSGNLTGLAMNFATAYDAAENWDTQTKYMRYSSVPNIYYYLPDGVDDTIVPKTKIDLTGDEYSIAFKVDVSSSAGTLGVLMETAGGTQGFTFYLKTTGGKACGIQMGGNLVQSLMTTVDLEATAGAFVSVVYTVKQSTGFYKFYFDGVEDNGSIVGSLPVLNYTTLSLFASYASSALTDMKFQDFVFTNDVMTITDAENHTSGNISSISNKLVWYKCNEPNTTSAPFTDKTIDYSGNDNHGTATNITASTFFNTYTNSVAVMASITAGTYYFFANDDEYAIVLKNSSNEYQQICFGKVQGTGTNTWIYATGTISGYIANYSTNNKYMLFSDDVLFTAVNYGTMFMYNLTTDIQYNDYDPTYIIEAPVDDVTASTMEKFLSDLWEKGVNQLKRIPPLNKLYLFLMSGSDRKYIGYSGLTRLVNITNTDAETEIVLGSDTFRVFPLHSEADTYYYRGIAIKK